IRYIVGSLATPVPLSPAISGNFFHGVWNGSMTVPQPATNVVLLADDGHSHIGSSNPFDVPSAGQSPMILTEPASQSAWTGGTVTFDVSAWGTPPLAYQWSFNGHVLSEATNASLTLLGVDAKLGGIYRVAVTNAYGAVASSNALLTVATA